MLLICIWSELSNNGKFLKTFSNTFEFQNHRTLSLTFR